jgi:hypothetical protein
MPAPIVGALISYLVDSLDLVVWDGEVQRQNTDGSNIEPNSDEGWPAVKIEMEEQGMNRLDGENSQTFEDSYGETGEITIYCWGTSREQLEGVAATPSAPAVPGVLTNLEVLLNNQDNVVSEFAPLAVYLGLSPVGDQYYFYRFNWKRWTCVQEKEVRAQLSTLLYRGEITFDVALHGMCASRSV